jgi:iron complex outermembrane receptor protein
VYAGLPHKSVHPYLQVTNVANSYYQEIPNVPMPGRTIVGGIELVFHKR